MDETKTVTLSFMDLDFLISSIAMGCETMDQLSEYLLNESDASVKITQEGGVTDFSVQR